MTAAELKRRYPSHWAEWSPARRRAELLLTNRVEKAAKRLNRAIEKSESIRKAGETAYNMEKKAALLEYANSEG